MVYIIRKNKLENVITYNIFFKVLKNMKNPKKLCENKLFFFFLLP